MRGGGGVPRATSGESRGRGAVLRKPLMPTRRPADAATQHGNGVSRAEDAANRVRTLRPTLDTECFIVHEYLQLSFLNRFRKSLHINTRCKMSRKDEPHIHIMFRRNCNLEIIFMLTQLRHASFCSRGKPFHVLFVYFEE